MTAVDFPTPAPGGSPFDMIRRTRPDGSEYWSAREAHDLAHRDDEHDEGVAA